jgi:hypothetical protein
MIAKKYPNCIVFEGIELASVPNNKKSHPTAAIAAPTQINCILQVPRDKGYAHCASGDPCGVAQRRLEAPKHLKVSALNSFIGFGNPHPVKGHRSIEQWEETDGIQN